MTENINPESALRKLCEKNYSKKENNLQEELIAIKKQQNDILENQKSLLDSVKTLQVQMMTMQDQHTKQLAKIQVTLNQIIQKKVQPELEFNFPIKSEESLEEVENNIQKAFEKYVTLIRNIILPEGLGTNLNRLFSLELIMRLNYNGVQGKKALSSYINLNKALFEALQHEGYTHSDYIRDLRSAFKSFKDKQYKKTYKAKKKTNDSLQESMQF